MSSNDHRNLPRRSHRSEAQREGSAALVYIMRAWEALTNEERLSWDLSGSQRRMKGVNYFKQVNLRRCRRGEELTRLPPQPKLHDPRPLLKGLDICNRGGCISLALQLRRIPDSPRTVWASLPCNLGLKKPRECPRLGGLPAPRRGWCDITKLYFQKHGEYIRQNGLPLLGKRIFVRVRPETDDGAMLYEQVKAVVPFLEAQTAKKAKNSSKEVRRGFEGVSKVHRSIRLAPRRP